MLAAKFILGFLLLIKGADLLIKGAIIFSEKMQFNRLIVGMILVSAGTSLPELVVNLIASFEGANGALIVGNVLGSNIANVFLVLGTLTLFYPVPVKKKLLKQELFINFLTFLLLIALIIAASYPAFLPLLKLHGWMTLFYYKGNIQISQIASIVLLLAFLTYLFFYFTRKQEKDLYLDQPPTTTPASNTKMFALILIGILFLSLGGEWIVKGADYLAQEIFHVSQGFIALTLVAIGTSLPELITSLMAGKKKEIELALGNVLGSNIFNVFFILGAAALVRPVSFPTFLLQDLLVWLASLLAVLLFSFKIFQKNHPPITYLAHKSGIFFLAAYALYLIFLAWRG